MRRMDQSVKDSLELDPSQEVQPSIDPPESRPKYPAIVDPDVPRSVGRPRKYDRDAVMTDLCIRVARGALVRDAAQAVGVSYDMIMQWSDAPEYRQMYERARLSQAHALAEQTLTIADGTDASALADPNLRRIQVDTRKWFVSKIAPKIYGEKIEVDHAGYIEHTVQFIAESRKITAG